MRKRQTHDPRAGTANARGKRGETNIDERIVNGRKVRKGEKGGGGEVV